MKTLKWFVIRHALAVDRRLWVGRSDAKRPLTKEGVQQFKKLLKKYHFAFKNKKVCLVTSDFERAIETAHLLAKWVKVVETCQTKLLRPNASPQKFVRWLAAQDKLINPRFILIIVGHEPQLSKLLGLLLTGHGQSFIQLKKGAIAELMFQPKGQLGRILGQKDFEGSFRLRSLVFPKHRSGN
ncbi:MAG: histidine phosphatase family protein [Bdellovibrionaceae bacterium]|nr:histidine phosphatase family protein [Pseudobdellovibrionaceae bacterium]MDW8189896.1 phosphoglycerate mutase family protein [Pseudobdellovibrionaceae bacterium]